MEKEQEKTEIERATPMSGVIILSFTAILCFVGGWLTNDIRGYIIGILFTFAVVNEVFKLGFELGGSRRTAGKIIYLVGVATIAIYYAFKNVNLLYMGLGILLALGGFVYFTQYGKKIKKYSVFQDKNLPLFAGIIIIVIILIQKILGF